MNTVVGLTVRTEIILMIFVTYMTLLCISTVYYIFNYTALV